MGIFAPVGVLTRTIVNVTGLIAEMLVVAAVVACFVVIHAFLQRRLKTEVLMRHNDVAGYLFSAVGVLYAVVLGFVVVVVWQKYGTTVDNVEAEANATGDPYHIVDGFDEPARRGSAPASETTLRRSLESSGPLWSAIQRFPRPACTYSKGFLCR